MNKRKLYRALWAALLCIALLCGTFAATADDIIVDIDIETEAAPSTASNDLALELESGLEDLIEKSPVIELDNAALALDDGMPSPELNEIEPDAMILSNDESTEPEADKVLLRVAYFGPTLTKEYDCSNLSVKNTGTQEAPVYAYTVTPPKAEDFRLEPAEGYEWVDGHRDVTIVVDFDSSNPTFIPFEKYSKFPSANAGNYELRFQFKLTGPDADYYTADIVSIPAAIFPREVVITPRTGLAKTYGLKDPAYKEDQWIRIKNASDGTYLIEQEVSGVPGYGVPLNTVDGKQTLTITNLVYLVREAQLRGDKKLFPNDGWLGRESGEDVGRHRITIGDVDFGPNFATTVTEEYFAITAKGISDEDVTVDDIPDRTYTGKEFKPKPVMAYNGKRLQAGKDYKLTYANNRKVGTAIVTITGKGNFTGRRVLNFDILPPKTAIAKLTAGKGQITVNWKKASGVGGYQVSYSLKSDFSDETKKNVKGASKKSLVLKNLQSSKIYYVRVRTYKGVNGKYYYSDWSKAKKVTTK